MASANALVVCKLHSHTHTTPTRAVRTMAHARDRHSHGTQAAHVMDEGVGSGGRDEIRPTRCRLVAIWETEPRFRQYHRDRCGYQNETAHGETVDDSLCIRVVVWVGGCMGAWVGVATGFCAVSTGRCRPRETASTNVYILVWRTTPVDVLALGAFQGDVGGAFCAHARL